MKTLFTAAVAVACAALTGCAAPPRAYYGHPALQPTPQVVYVQPAPVYYTAAPAYAPVPAYAAVPQPYNNDPVRVGAAAVLGGVIGSQFGHGDGRIAGAAVGAATGAMLAQGGEPTGQQIGGAILGGVIGSRFGGGEGRKAAAAVGAGLGAWLAAPQN